MGLHLQLQLFFFFCFPLVFLCIPGCPRRRRWGRTGVAFGGASCQPEDAPHCTWVAIKTGTVLRGGIQIHENRHNLPTTLDIKIASD